MKMFVQAWHDNDVTAFAVAAGIALAVLVVVAIVRFVVSRAIGAVARRTQSAAAQSAASAASATRLWLFIPLALAVAGTYLELPPRLEDAIGIAAVTFLVVQAGLWATFLIRAWVQRKTTATGIDGDAVTALALLGFAARVAVWVVVLLFILDHLGFNITALVAGLGIGGIAVALAVQNILGDLFASLSIVLDKPFVVGDFIIIDEHVGTVERIGVKTTRIKSLGGETLVFSNSDLLKSRIRNYKQLTERRIAFTVGVTYETSLEHVRSIAAMLREIVESVPKTRFDRAHFKSFGDSSLDYEVVYYVLDPTFLAYRDIQHAINVAIFERFSNAGISIAYPTRTLHIVPPEAQEAGAGA